MSVAPLVGAADPIAAVMAQRAAILERSQALGRSGRAGMAALDGAAEIGGARFGALLDRALGGAAASSRAAGAASSAFERGASDDIAGVMLARQTASIDFQMALQVRNRLLGAYRDIMNMPI